MRWVLELEARDLLLLPRGSVAAGDEIVAHAVAQTRGAGGDIAAVDGDLGTADKARLIRRKKQHEIGAFLWRALAMVASTSWLFA